MKRLTIIATILGLVTAAVLYVRWVFTRPYEARPFSDPSSNS